MIRLPHRQSLWTIFRWPLLLAILSLSGLVGALLADGVLEWLGTAMIAVSVVAIAVTRARSGKA